MRVAYGVLLVSLLLAAATPYAHSTSYTPQTLSVTIYADGTVGVTYDVAVDPTLVRVSVPIFGTTFPDLIVVNENGLPLATTQSGSTITVDSLGASELTFTYSTSELTSKVGILWSFNVTSPSNLVTLLPAGSTIISMSQIPVDVQTVGGQTQVTLPAGADSISYVISSFGTKEHAQMTIQDAEATINSVKARGVITTDADNLLAQAKTALNAGDYAKAEQLGSQAKTSALDASALAQTAQSSIQRATSATQTARNEGRTSTLTTAEGLLANAQGYYASGDYAKAKSSADQAYDAAITSKAATDLTLLMTGGALILIVAVAAVILYSRRRREAPAPQALPAQTPKGAEEGAVNLDEIFRRNPDLRVDDKEVIRFLSERSGEAFANEIRDRFDIPRTSAWRMIRRLISLGIVEERKIGGQSLIYVVKKYREAQG